MRNLNIILVNRGGERQLVGWPRDILRQGLHLVKPISIFVLPRKSMEIYLVGSFFGVLFISLFSLFGSFFLCY